MFLASGGKPAIKDVKLWKNALRLNGWSHINDNANQEGIRSNDWYPGWEKNAKHYEDFMKNTDHRQVVQNRLEAKGEFTKAEAIKRFGTAGLAHWRWHTLVKPCIKCEKTYESFKEGSIKNDFKIREDNKLNTIVLLHHNPRFQVQTKYLTLWEKEMNALRTWGAGCLCHEAELKAGKRCTCFLKGRRIPEVPDRVCLFCREADIFVANLQESADAPVFRGLSKQVAATKGYLVAKTEYIQHVPNVIALCRNRKHAKRARAEYRSLRDNAKSLEKCLATVSGIAHPLMSTKAPWL